MSRIVLAAMSVLVLAVMAGCGGGSDSVAPKPTGNNGVLTGSVDLDSGSPEDCTLVLNGRQLPVKVNADGTFRIPNVPPGEHVLDIIGPDGSDAGRTEFDIDPNEELELPPIRVLPAGQIVGLVIKNDNGVWVPAVGVEVIARSDLMWIMTDTGAPTLVPEGSSPGAAPSDDGTGSEIAPLIYPPPPGFSYSAVTDETGSFVMRGVDPGSYFVTVAVAGYLTGETFVWVDAGHTAVADFQLWPDKDPEVGTITGLVTGVKLDGTRAPLADVTIEAYMEAPWIMPRDPEPIDLPPDVRPDLPVALGASDPNIGRCIPPIIDWRVFSTVTDENGMYSLEVPAGNRRVAAWAWPYEWAEQEVRVPVDGTVRANFVLNELDYEEPIVVGPEPLPDAPVSGR